jgi:prolyl oligopeptidase
MSRSEQATVGMAQFFHGAPGPRRAACALIGSLLAAGPTAAQDTTAPPTRVTDARDTIHGVEIADPYRWLEDSSSEEVGAWVAKQSARTRAYLDGLPFYAALHQKLESMITQTSPRNYALTYAGGRLFSMYFDPKRQQPLLVVMGPDADPARAKTVVDPNALDPKAATAIDWYVPSPDGRRVAVSLSSGGSEAGTLHVFETASGKRVGEAIVNVQYPTGGGDVAWSPDGSGFWYTRYPAAQRPEDRGFHQQVYYHRIGRDPSRDARVFGDGLPKVAEIQMDYSPDAGKLLVAVANGDGGQFAHFVRGADGKFLQVTRFDDEVDFAKFGPDGALYLVSKRDAPRRKILKLAPGEYTLARAKTIVPEGSDVVPIEFAGEDPLVFAGERMYVRYLAGGPSRIRVFDLDGKSAGDVPLPDVAAVDEMEPAGASLLYGVETYLAPLRYYRFENGRSFPTALEVRSPFNFDDSEVRRAWVTSKDGTRVPINIIARKGTQLEGSNPVLLYGYGGYGISETPFFLGSSRRLWLDAGGVFVTTNLRGGGEFGEEWHRQGMLTRKQNVFDDFIAAAEYLVKEGYTTPSRLAILGGSNGGLLMGAVLTQRPDLFRAVVSQVGIYDMLRVELDPNGEFNTTEFGSVRDPEQFRALLAYSPYHHVREGVKYPAVLLQTGDNDGRVNPMHSRKMAARLQAATASGYPIYLISSGAAGHGIGSPLALVIGMSADWQAFLYDQLGMGSAITQGLKPTIH